MVREGPRGKGWAQKTRGGADSMGVWREQTAFSEDGRKSRDWSLGTASTSTCHAGSATRSPSTEGATRPLETTSISEPSRASASLYCLTPPRPQSRVRPGSQIPGHRVFLHLLVENNRGVKGAACLLETRWDQRMVGRSSLRSRECSLARP